MPVHTNLNEKNHSVKYVRARNTDEQRFITFLSRSKHLLQSWKLFILCPAYTRVFEFHLKIRFPKCDFACYN